MGKFFSPQTAMSYAFVVFNNGQTTNRASVQKWDKYSLRFGVMKLKRYILRTFPEKEVKMIIIYDNSTRQEIERMVPFTDSWNGDYHPH
jgi:hypothetical protein